jgi:MFS family permease
MFAGMGPVLGGWLVGHFSWRWAFFINVPLVVAVLLILFARVPESRDDQAERSLDWLGALLATAGLGAIVYGLVESSYLGLINPIVLSSIVFGVALLFGFVVNEAKSKNPMMPLKLFRSRSFTGANLLTLLLFLPFNLIQVQRYSTTAAGAALLPFILIMSLLSRWAGSLINRFGAKLPLIIGPVIASTGFALFAIPSIGGSYWATIFPAITALGVGMVISVAPLTTTVMGSVPAHYSGVASGINNAVARTAGLLAIALLSILMVHGYGASLDRRMNDMNLSAEVKSALDQQRSRLVDSEIPKTVDDNTRTTLKQAIDESFVTGFRQVIVVSAILALLGAVSASLLIERQFSTEGSEYKL